MQKIIIKHTLLIILLSIGFSGSVYAGGDDRDHGLVDSLDEAAVDDYASFEPSATLVDSQSEEALVVEQTPELEQSEHAQPEQPEQPVQEPTLAPVTDEQEFDQTLEVEEVIETMPEKSIEETSEVLVESAVEPDESLDDSSSTNQLPLILFAIGALIAIAFFVRQYSNIRNKRV